MKKRLSKIRSSVKASPDGAVAKSSDSGMAGTGFAYPYRIQPWAGLKTPLNPIRFH